MKEGREDYMKEGRKDYMKEGRKEGRNFNRRHIPPSFCFLPFLPSFTSAAWKS
jgi:hypothetical protein